jgi:hypothetical protein
MLPSTFIGGILAVLVFQYIALGVSLHTHLGGHWKIETSLAEVEHRCYLDHDTNPTRTVHARSPMLFLNIVLVRLVSYLQWLLIKLESAYRESWIRTDPYLASRETLITELIMILMRRRKYPRMLISYH